MSSGCYDIPALEFRSRSVYTNKMALGAYRGAGRPEAAYYVERAIDLLADAAGLDPVEVRRRNFIAPFEHSYTTASGERYDTGDYAKALDYAIEVSGYEALRAEQAAERKNGRYLGIGLASYVEICGFGPFESATVRVETNGDVTVYTGISPHGQGQETSFAQIVGDGLGVPMEKIGVNHGDTLNTPQGNGTMGSRGLAVGGGAVVLALNKVRDRATAIAAHLLEAAAEDIEIVEGAFRVRGVPDRGVSLEEIAEKAYSDELPAEFGAGLEVRLLKFVSVDDCGVIISPTLVRGQVHGGVAQGIGQALLEEIVYDDSGELITGTLNDYAIPRAVDFPPFETYHTETPTYLNPLGAKGIGEAATIGSTPAVANAVIDALEPWGITHVDVPLTPERVWRAIQGASVGAAAAD
jgi:CO/xanthine dehydrogenase Mo-binding subunit